MDDKELHKDFDRIIEMICLPSVLDSRLDPFSTGNMTTWREWCHRNLDEILEKKAKQVEGIRSL